MEEKKWEDLPMDCLVNVFGRLSIKDRIMGVPLVCKPWYTAYLNPDCWRILKFHEPDLKLWCNRNDFYYGSMRFSHVLRCILDRSCGSATVVRLPTFFTKFQNLRLVSEQCPLLQVFYLPYFSTTSKENLSELICKWKDLQFLYLLVLPSKFGAIIEEINHHCKKFTGLQVRGQVDDEATSAIIKWVPRIKYLVLNGSFISKKSSQYTAWLQGAGAAKRK